MDNQHRKIDGYRELSQAEIDMMNTIKAMGPQMEELLAKVSAHVQEQRQVAHAAGDQGVENSRMDRAQPERWAAIARTHFQEGLMALTRAVAQPTFF